MRKRDADLHAAGAKMIATFVADHILPHLLSGDANSVTEGGNHNILRDLIGAWKERDYEFMINIRDLAQDLFDFQGDDV